MPWLPQSKDLQGRCYIDPARSWNSEFPWSCAPWRGRTQPLKTWTQIAQFWTSRARAKKLGRAPDVRRHVPAGSLRAPQLTAREKPGGRRRRACQCPQNRHTAVFNIFSHVVFTSINIFFLRQWRPVLHFGNLEICAFFVLSNINSSYYCCNLRSKCISLALPGVGGTQQPSYMLLSCKVCCPRPA